VTDTQLGPLEELVPLSEEELRALEQMERALLQEDPKFASTLRGTSMRQSARRRAIAAGVVFVLGVCLLMGGAIAQQMLIGVAGFVVMLASATAAVSSMKSQQVAADPRVSADPTRGFRVIDGGRSTRLRRTGKSPSSSDSFMARMEERWRRRREQGGL
jgi:hypothetical protein